ncbi:hypothetical protein ACWCXX_33480, partial [Streptomyces sp. NPDC001732]
MSDDPQSGGPRESAVAGGWLADPGWLVNTDPERVLAVLGGAVGREEVLAAAVYRASAHLHRDAEAGVRRQLLALDAARYGDRGLAALITVVPAENDPAARWGVDWATGSMVTPQLWHTLNGHTNGVRAVATAVVDSHTVAVIGSDEGTVRVWDLVIGQPVGEPLTGHISGVLAVATAVVDGRTVAVTGSWDETVRVWNLITGQGIGEPLTGHTDGVLAVATAVVGGRSVAVTGSWDETVRVWNLVTGQGIGEPLTGHTDGVCAVATAV